MTLLRDAWVAALVASWSIAACGGTSTTGPGEASGAPQTGGASALSAGSSGAQGVDAPVGGAGGSDPGLKDLMELGDCSPLEDTCPDGTYCQWREGRTECIETGSTKRDALCEETETCQRGSICLSAGEFSGKTCQQPCPLGEEPWNVCDIGRHTCFVAVDDEDRELPFGVCRY